MPTATQTVGVMHATPSNRMVAGTTLAGGRRRGRGRACRQRTQRSPDQRAAIRQAVSLGAERPLREPAGDDVVGRCA